MAPISVPIASRLPSSLRIASQNDLVARMLNRLSRSSLISLALDWLDESNQSLTAPYLKRRQRDEEEEDDDDDADFYPAAASIEVLQEHYADLQMRKGPKREVLDRMLEGDWRHGLSMYQLAMADLQHLYDHPTSQRWTAFQIIPLKADMSIDGDDSSISVAIDKASLVVPRFHPSSFLRNLQAQILPDIKVHYNLDRHKHLPMLILRIFIVDSPYNTSLAVSASSSQGAVANVESFRTVYIAFPDASPFIYLASTQSTSPTAGERVPGTGGTSGVSTVPVHRGRTDMLSLRSLVVEAIPKALSRPRERYALKPTSLVTRNLSELLQRRGGGRTNTAGGGWSIYADEKSIESPLSTLLPPSVASQLEGASANKENNEEERGTTNRRKPENIETEPQTKRAASPGTVREERLAKRRKQVAAARFGLSAQMDDGHGVERVDIVMQDPFPGIQHFDLEDGADGGGEEEDEVSTSRPVADRRKSKGDRRSRIDAVLAREEEDEEAERAAAGRALAEEEENDDNNGDDGVGEPKWCPRVAFTFHGPHVFAGIRQLVEAGIIDGERMPGWLTGEEGVTVGAVRHGRIRGHKGSGLP